LKGTINYSIHIFLLLLNNIVRKIRFEFWWNKIN